MGLDKVSVLPRRTQIRRHKPAGRTKAGRIHQTVKAVFFLGLLRIIARLSQDIIPLRDRARAISHSPQLLREGREKNSEPSGRRANAERSG
ncbi:hypothetical protein NPIL_548151 [Nephila pilipes]|uniref:Uncharacterized protein n=1 Tax=Nephila pilipes TaxID=299642 RepID=A0A8X6PWH7_NEPPI|nr:hypothetical protein NPIL_548151 [Nephila pilipes]